MASGVMAVDRSTGSLAAAGAERKYGETNYLISSILHILSVSFSAYTVSRDGNIHSLGCPWLFG